MWPNRSWSSASRAVSGCLEFPGASSSFLATTLYTARLTGACSAALRANQKKQSPRGLRPIVEGWRMIATRDETNSRRFRLAVNGERCPRVLPAMPCRALDGGLLKLSFRKESEHCTADAELNDLRGSIGGSHQIGRIVACIDVPELVAMIIDLRVEEGRVFISSSGLIQESIHLLRKLRQGQVPMRRDHPQRSLHHRHDERSGDALA